MMKAVSSALLCALFSTVLLAGCGQKGPLYLPGQAPESQTQGPLGIDDDSSETRSSGDNGQNASETNDGDSGDAQ